MNKNIGITFGVKTVDTTDEYVLLEQGDYEDAIGVVTTLNLVRGIADALYESGSENSIDCGLEDDGSFNTVVYAYPSSPALYYNFGITHGNQVAIIVQNITVRELVKFRLTDKSNTRYPAHAIVSIQWQGQVWDEEGRVVAAPSLSTDGRVVTSSKVVYGTAIVSYRTFREMHKLNIPPRTQDAYGIYDSVAYARWNGGVEMIDIDPPTAAEENYNSDQDCGWKTIVNINDHDEPPSPPTLDSEYDEVHIDYCTQEYDIYG